MRKVIYVDDLVSELHYYDKKQKTDIWMTSEIEEILDNIPAADAVPVVHGHWIDDCTYIVCSECGAEYSDEIIFMDRDFKYSAIPYCPNCGARMIKEEI